MKKELIKAIKAHLKETEGENARGTFDQGYEQGLECAIGFIEQFIKESEKVVVPRFVADWIKECKEKDISLGYALYSGQAMDVPQLDNWFADSDNKNMETFARAWLDGYTVEKEKLYKVELPIDRTYHILTVHSDNSGHFFGKEHINDSWYRTYLTEQEIKAIDERYLAFKVEVTE